MERRWMMFVCSVLAILLVTPVLAGCGSSGEESEVKTIVIGDLTDITGPAAAAMTPISWALVDYCNYVNSEGLIPNVKLEVVQYDTKYDTSRYLLGYDSVKAQGATLVFTGFPGCAEALKTRAENDKIPVFCCSATEGLVDNPGAVFCFAGLTRGVVPAQLRWVHENDWKGTGPATIGMASWNVAPNPDTESALKKYCEENPSQFRLAGTSLVPAGTITWAGEVARFKDCDYLFFGSGGAVAPATFIDQYRAAGGKGKILCTDTLLMYVKAIVDQAGWDAVDGMLQAVNWGWWVSDSDQVRLAKQLLEQNHPDQIGPSHLFMPPAGGLIEAHVAVEAIRAVVKEIGTEDLSSQAIYDGLERVSFTLPGYPTMDWSESREGLRYFQMWNTSKAQQDLVLASDWIPNAE